MLKRKTLIALLDKYAASAARHRWRHSCIMEGCGTVRPCDPHHIISRNNLWSRWEPWNIVLLCREHHEWAHANKKEFMTELKRIHPDIAYTAEYEQSLNVITGFTRMTDLNLSDRIEQMKLATTFMTYGDA